MNTNKYRLEEGYATNSYSYTAPKDIFNRCNICYDSGKRLELKEIKEKETDKEYILIYKLSNTVQLDSFISILRAFETETICFAYCDCRGYDEDGYRAYSQINNIENMHNLDDEFASPYINFDAIFCDRETHQYRFSLTSDVNSSVLIYYVKLAKYGKEP